MLTCAFLQFNPRVLKDLLAVISSHNIINILSKFIEYEYRTIPYYGHQDIVVQLFVDWEIEHMFYHTSIRMPTKLKKGCLDCG